MFVGKFLERNLFAIRHVVRAAYAKHKFRRNKRQLVVGVFHHFVKNGNAEVNRTCVYQFAHLQRACFQHFQFHVGVQFVVFVEDFRAQKSAYHGRHGNFYMVAVVAHVFHLHGKRVHGLQNVIYFVQKIRPFDGELQAVVSAVKQAHAKLVFKFLYAKGNCRLTDKHFFCRLGNASVATYRLKILHLQQLHLLLLPSQLAAARSFLHQTCKIQSSTSFIYSIIAKP